MAAGVLSKFGLYMHMDSTPPINVAYDIGNIRIEDHSVTIDAQTRLHVVEHLFSALCGLSLFNVRVDVYGDELPFFDGSSWDFVQALKVFENGYKRTAMLRDSVEVTEGESHLSYTPSNGGSMIFEMSLTHPHIGTQHIVINAEPKNYASEVAPARTFLFVNENDPRLQRLPPYGIGITKRSTYSAQPLRFPDEPVRHKLLDLLGDLYILRTRLVGKITGVNTSHRLNLLFASKLLRALNGES
jgi:UDP-3-O-[3-hydroxymyristoyl] N-acetylglucosamine deacetylase